MSVHLQSVHFSAEKVVTMLQKRNQVFERVFCADVQAATPRIAAAPATAPVQAPRWNLESLLPRGLWHAARIGRGDMCMHMWAPRGRLMSMCAWICCAAYLSFLVFCSDASTVDTVVAMPASLLSRATLPLLDGVHIAIFIRAKHKGYMERDVRRVHELSCTIVAI